MTTANVAIWVVAALAVAGVVARPWRLPEAAWSVAAALLLLALRLVSPREALGGVAKGVDVYLFLTGMMLLAEVARHTGLFDYLACVATKRAQGSARRLFLLVYAVGVLVTTFLSNDATAVVLTPAVAAAVKRARAERPLPYLLSCAFVANAASFVLPISNPANLVVFGARVPSLAAWLPRFLLPSAASVIATYLALRTTQKAALAQSMAVDVEVPKLRKSGIAAALGIAATSVALLAASAKGTPLGPPTAVAGALTLALVSISTRSSPLRIARRVSWSVLALVAGLFVVVEALEKTGAVSAIAAELRAASARSTSACAWIAGAAIGVGTNLVNNLPGGLLAGSAVRAAQAPEPVANAVMIGVDLGPNLSVTGSLATILWLTALRREGLEVRTTSFLKIGALVMPTALALALASALALR